MGKKPKIFIGSSKEGLKIAEQIRENLFHYANCVLWSDPGIFEPSEFILESLTKVLEYFSYAIFVMSPDDIIITRETEYPSPRDNLIFECGLFAGRHGRHSVFIVVPFGEDIKLPSDLNGFNRCEYKIFPKGQIPSYDISTACTEILRTIQKDFIMKHTTSSVVHRTSKFWDVLSDVVVIVFGMEDPAKSHLYTHPRISPRDLQSAQIISNFLSRVYPKKKVLSFPATTTGWHHLLQVGADLIIIGGFVTNIEFAKHFSKLKRHFYIKMGRICRVKDKCVYHVDFNSLPPGLNPPPPNKPQSIEDFPSEYVSQDFGMLINIPIKIYGSKRRVIGIAGIKGNGTRGAAIHVTDDNDCLPHLDSFLDTPLTDEDSLEIIINTKVNNDIIDQTELIELILNDKKIYLHPNTMCKQCELDQHCKDCTFGETSSRLYNTNSSSSTKLS